MNITGLHIRNFRAIRSLDVRGLKSLVVIAGPNGCGKSCIFDALRLLKSVYGGYQQNEYTQWFGEFQININTENQDLTQIFRDPARAVEIEAVLQLADSERSYIKTNMQRLAENLAWSDGLQQPTDETPLSAQALALRHPQVVPRIEELTQAYKTLISESLGDDDYKLSLRINSPTSSLDVTPCTMANLVFRTYDPDNLGILDYYSAARTYAREGVGGVSLDLDTFKAQRRNFALYNWQSKYTSIKTEVISSYVSQLIKEQAGSAIVEGSDTLDETLAEMFRLFFPNKTYLGVTPQADGKLAFPVKLSSGETHDLNELSSGEKEVLYGYLRLRNQTPRNSTILLDEPELHLNPGLLRGFPQFYYRHLVQPTANQLWMVTHSDTLLRESVGNDNFSVFHMIPATSESGESNQLVVLAKDQLEEALLGLVGDLAAYRPAARVIVLEGGGDSEFDVRVVSQLFPSLTDSATLISGGGKGRVAELYRVLSETAQQTGVSNRFFAIIDRDSGDQPDRSRAGHVYSWDVYHIENYLLDVPYIYKVYRGSAPRPTLTSESDVLAALRECAESQVDRLVAIELRDRIDRRLNRCIRIAADPNSTAPVADLLRSITGTKSRWEEAIAEVADVSILTSWEAEIRSTRMTQLTDETWLQLFPGRDILKTFVHVHLAGVTLYEGVVTALLTAMSEDGHQPVGMRAVIDDIMSSPAGG